MKNWKVKALEAKNKLAQTIEDKLDRKLYNIPQGETWGIVELGKLALEIAFADGEYYLFLKDETFKTVETKTYKKLGWIVRYIEKLMKGDVK